MNNNNINNINLRNRSDVPPNLFRSPRRANGDQMQLQANQSSVDQLANPSRHALLIRNTALNSQQFASTAAMLSLIGFFAANIESFTFVDLRPTVDEITHDYYMMPPIPELTLQQRIDTDSDYIEQRGSHPNLSYTTSTHDDLRRSLRPLLPGTRAFILFLVTRQFGCHFSAIRFEKSTNDNGYVIATVFDNQYEPHNLVYFERHPWYYDIIKITASLIFQSAFNAPTLSTTAMQQQPLTNRDIVIRMNPNTMFAHLPRVFRLRSSGQTTLWNVAVDILHSIPAGNQRCSLPAILAEARPQDVDDIGDMLQLHRKFLVELTHVKIRPFYRAGNLRRFAAIKALVLPKAAVQCHWCHQWFRPHGSVISPLDVVDPRRHRPAPPRSNYDLVFAANDSQQFDPIVHCHCVDPISCYDCFYNQEAGTGSVRCHRCTKTILVSPGDGLLYCHRAVHHVQRVASS